MKKEACKPADCEENWLSLQKNLAVANVLHCSLVMGLRCALEKGSDPIIVEIFKMATSQMHILSIESFNLFIHFLQTSEDSFRTQKLRLSKQCPGPASCYDDTSWFLWPDIAELWRLSSLYIAVLLSSAGF